MKKQKMLKLNAFISEPSIENSFSAPLTHSGEISVVSKGKNISIHGWDGNAWSTIHTLGGTEQQFKFENTYEKYFLKSLTGQEEEIYVSFFSTGSIQNSQPQLAGIQRPTKLYDVDEVPIYTAADANKLLTVMSDGSLRWLLLNETFNVDGSPVIATPVISYVEDRSDLTLGAGTTISNSIANIGYNYSASLQVGGAGSAGPFRSLFETYAYSVSFLVKTTNTADMVFVADHWRGTSNGFFVQYGANGVFYFIKANGTGAVTSPNSTQVLRDGSWHHVTLTVSPGGAQKLYIDGNEFCSVNVGGNAPFNANSTLSFGWLEKGPNAQDTGRPVGGQMDQILVHDSTLTAQEVSDLHAAGRGESEPAQTYLEETATLYGDASVSGGTLVLDGNGDYAVIDDGFRFTDVLSTSIWFKTTATGDRRIYSSHVRGMSGDDFKNGFFARLNNGQLKYRHPSGGTAEFTGPSGLNDGQWHHMAVTWENNVGYTLYVDGSQVATGGAGASDGYASGWGLYIGANPWLNNNPYGFFSGEVSKFEVLNEVLTAQDVTDRYNAGV